MTILLDKIPLELAEKLVKDDPVRPDIPASVRQQNHFQMFQTENAVICVAFCNKVPKTQQGLLESKPGNIAVFYSVWSYQKGAGRDIVLRVIEEARKRGMSRFVTMSPKTQMAERFHIRNGAELVSENETTNNFEYL